MCTQKMSTSRQCLSRPQLISARDVFRQMGGDRHLMWLPLDSLRLHAAHINLSAAQLQTYNPHRRRNKQQPPAAYPTHSLTLLMPYQQHIWLIKGDMFRGHMQRMLDRAHLGGLPCCIVMMPQLSGPFAQGRTPIALTAAAGGPALHLSTSPLHPILLRLYLPAL